MVSGQTDQTVNERLQQVSGLLQSGAIEDALAQLNRLERAHPGQTEIIRFHGIVLSRLGRDEEARQAFRQLTALLPDSAHAASDLANVSLKLGEPQEALDVLLRHVPGGEGVFPGAGSATLNFNLGRAWKACGHAGNAVRPLQQTLEEEPEHYPALVSLGDCFKALGDPDRAAACFRRAMALRPGDGTAWWSLSNLKAGGFTESEFTRLKELAADATSLPQKVFFGFSLARGFDERDQVDEAFDHYREANRLKRQMEPWDRAEFSCWLRSIENAMERVGLPKRESVLKTPRPVFIVSLPRSGSTLTEQILAAHSQVEAAGELPWLPRLMAQVSGTRPGGIAGWAPSLGAEDWKRLGRDYMDHCRTWSEAAPVFTDKLPGNIPYVGAILAMLPNALIVNVRRDPMDVCWSCYRQLFIGGAGFANDLQDLAAYWKDHERHMAYWHERAPDRVLDIDYESLVKNTGREVRRLLEFLDLGFEEACLKPHEAQRAVHTASASQVREAINVKGLGHWRRYREHLGELQQAFENSMQ